MIKEFIEISSGKFCLHFSENQNNDLPYLFCIHGGLGLGSDSLFEGLNGLCSHFNLIFIDLRGCGESDTAFDSNYSLKSFSKDVFEIVEKLKINGLKIVFGHSLGGMVVLEILHSYPKLFPLAVVSNTAMNSSWQKAASKAVEKLNQNSLSKALDDFTKIPNSNEALKKLAIEYGPIYFPELSESESKKIMSTFSYRTDAISYCNKNVYPQMDLSSYLKDIQIPVLIIGGEKDIVVPLICQEELERGLSIPTIDFIPKAGHFPFITQKKDFTYSITTWWKELRGRP